MPLPRLPSRRARSLWFLIGLPLFALAEGLALPYAGSAAGALSFVWAAASGWVLGGLGGLWAGLLACGVHLFLNRLLGGLPSMHGPRFPVADVFGFAFSLLVGLAGGRLRDLLARLQEQAQQLRLLDAGVQSSRDGIAILRAGEAGLPTIEYVNASFARLTGMEPGHLIGRPADALLGAEPDEDAARTLRDHLTRGVPYRGELPTRRVGGAAVHLDVTADPIPGHPIPGQGGRASHLVLVQRDVTEHKRLEQQLAHWAHHDALTGLPNRRLLAREARARLARGEPLTLLLLDLNRFKVVNDSLGHEAGDALLREVAGRLRGSVPPGHVLARLGGDEFAILAPGEVRSAEALARHVTLTLREPFTVAGQRLVIGASIGLAHAPLHGRDHDELLQRADVAMYQAKTGGEPYAHYQEGAHTWSMGALQLEGDLRRAIGARALTLHYQPIVRAAGGDLVGCEALVRWPHPGRGPLSPAHFIPLAEESGLIADLDAAVLDLATRDWAGGEGFVSVNLSARSLSHPDLIARVAPLLERLPRRGDLVLEITESAAMRDPDLALNVMHDLKALGVRLAIDDFGAGHSSLTYLKRFPADIVKIDKSFVGAIGQGARDEYLIQVTVALAHQFGLQALAEGVETPEQLAWLAAHGCDLVQGYLIGRPAPAPPWSARAVLADG